MKALYRKINDGSINSSTYHKKDCTAVYSRRAMMKEDLRNATRQGA